MCTYYHTSSHGPGLAPHPGSHLMSSSRDWNWKKEEEEEQEEKLGCCCCLILTSCWVTLGHPLCDPHSTCPVQTSQTVPACMSVTCCVHVALSFSGQSFLSFIPSFIPSFFLSVSLTGNKPRLVLETNGLLSCCTATQLHGAIFLITLPFQASPSYDLDPSRPLMDTSLLHLIACTLFAPEFDLGQSVLDCLGCIDRPWAC